LSKSWNAPFDPLKYQKQTIMNLVEDLEFKDTSRGYLPPYKPLVVAHTSPNNDCTLLDVTIGLRNSHTRLSECRWLSNGKRIGCIVRK